MKVEKQIIGIAVLVMAQLAMAQQSISLGENTKLSAGGLFTFGYQGDYGDAVPSNHGLDLGFDGRLSGSYYNPNFISFTAHPYYDQSRVDSSSQSLTGASGIDGAVNFFTGSNYPGSVTFNYDRNSTGTFGLAGQPDFTTVGTGHGFGINWSALHPNWPTLSVGYSQGAGNSTLYGTDQKSDSSTRLFNVHSNYQLAGFRLNAYYTHNSLNSVFPAFLSGEEAQVQNSTGSDLGFGAQHSLPMHGLFYVNFNRASADNNFQASDGQGNGTSDVSSYTDNNETANATFHPTQKFSFNVTQNYTSNLNGYLLQNIGGGVGSTGENLGSGSHSSTIGGGGTYQFTNFLSATGQGTYYDQYYFGQSYTGAYLAGTVNYGRRLWNMFTFSGSVIDSSNGQGQNSVGFMGNANFYRRFGNWTTSGQFSYAQNVQTVLITYLTSYYSYRANVGRRLPGGMQWIAAFTGNHSGLTQDQGTSSHGESYSSSLSMRRLAVNSFFSQSSGVSLLGAGGIIQPESTPGLTDYILFTGSSYGGGLTLTPIRRLSISGTFSRAISNTISTTDSHNNTEIFNAQMQYHLRRIGLQAGYTRFTQGISAVGTPVNTTSYFVGMTRWFDFF
jgi:hypothetical protein